MKKLIGIAVVIALLSFVACAEASVGYRKDGAYDGAVADINIDGFASKEDRILTIFSNGHRSGVTDVVTELVTNLTSKYLAYGVMHLDDIGSMNDSGGITRSIGLADGTPGQMITVILESDSGGTLYIGDDQVPASGDITKTGWDDIAFDSALDSVTLLYVDDTVGWIIVGMNSVTVT